MALQTCKRCRTRRIKCDLNLPGCNHCLQADVECYFYDEALKEDIPRRYYLSLQEKSRQLEREIKRCRETKDLTSNEVDNFQRDKPPNDREYHLNIAENILESPHLSSSYVGPGSSASLMQYLMNSFAEWHMENQPQTERPCPISEFLELQSSSSTIQSHKFHTNLSQQKLEPSTLIPPSTQRALVEHYFKVIEPEYPLFSSEQERKFLDQEAPLKWDTNISGHSDRLYITAIAAVASALICRDFDSSLSSAADLLRESFHLSSNQPLQTANSVADMKFTISVICLSAILELVCTISNDCWSQLGHAIATMEQLQAEHEQGGEVYDSEFYRLQYTLLKLECRLAAYTRRQSRVLDIWPALDLDVKVSTPVSAHFFRVHIQLRKIVQSLQQSPMFSPNHMEEFIPEDLRITSSSKRSIPQPAAELYISLHPLYTSRVLDILFDRPLGIPVDLLHTIAQSALSIIDNIAQASKESKLICIWMTAERLLEAGAVWSVYLICLRRSRGLSHLGSGGAIGPLTKCSTLFAQFAEKWKRGAIFVEIWEMFLIMFWDILG